MNVVPGEKDRLRLLLHGRLKELSAREKEDCSKRAASHLAEWLAERPALQRVASYAALPSELDLRGLLGSAALSARSWFFPRVREGGMDFYRVSDPRELHPGTLGVREPSGSPARLLEPAECDLILCPGLGFSKGGARLGRGKGYYDWFLAQCRPSTIRMGVGFEIQFLSSLPTETHDQALDYLLTEEGIEPADRKE